MNHSFNQEEENSRVKALHALGVLDTEEEDLYNGLVSLASQICNTPMALINLVDENRVWVKAKYGLDVKELPREKTFCHHTVQKDGILEIKDATKDSIFKYNDYVVGDPHIKFYAGVPLITPDHHQIGTLCVMDTKPHKLGKEQKEALEALSGAVINLISLRKSNRELQRTQEFLKTLNDLNEAFIASEGNKRPLFKSMLEYILRIAESEYGFIGEVLTRDGQPYLKSYAITNIAWNQETQDLYQKYEAQGMEFTNLHTLFGHTMRTGEVVIANSPSDDPRRGGLPNGHPAMHHYLGIPIKDSKGNLIGMMGLANKKGGYEPSDVTFLEPLISACGTMILSMQIDARNELVQKENDLIAQRLIDAQAIAKIGNWEYNVQTKEQLWSEEHYKIFELPHLPKDELYDAYFKRIHPEDREALDVLLEETISTGKNLVFEHRAVFEDGRTKHLLGLGYPVKNENGEVVIIRGTCQDITEQKKRDEELLRFFEVSNALLCIMNKEGVILKHNNAYDRLLGSPGQDSKRKSIMEMCPPRMVNTAKGMIVQALKGKGSVSFELDVWGQESAYIPLNWTLSYDERTDLIYASAEDVRAKKEAEARLLESKLEAEKAQQKDQFLANMSHEIRTPLNAIIGFNDLLSNTTLNNEQRRHVETIAVASKSLNVLINDILDISKLESGRLELEKKPFNIEKIARQIVQMNAPKAKAKGIKLLFSFDQEIPSFVVGDETRLTQIILNLVSNAIKFTPYGQVELKMLEKSRDGLNSEIEIMVTDSGIGIPPDKLATIFERFTQAESYTTRVYGGTGLGLNIVKSLVELHDGSLDVKSQLGEGSTFSVCLRYPISELGENETGAEDNHAEESKIPQGTTILLVEDNEHNQILAQTYLERNGARVEIAPNGSIALKKFADGEYDLILMDIQMPVMDGHETTRIIRNELHADIPIIGCSAHALASEKAKCMEIGMNDYITKPYNEALMVKTIAKQLSKGEKAHSAAISEEERLVSEDLQSLKQLEREEGKEFVNLVVNLFKKTTAKDIAELETHHRMENYKSLSEKAHYLFGTLANLRFLHGCALCKEVELSAKSEAEEKTTLATQALVQYLGLLASKITA